MTPLGWLGRKTSTQTKQISKPNSCALHNFWMVWNILITFGRGIKGPVGMSHTRATTLTFFIMYLSPLKPKACAAKIDFLDRFYKKKKKKKNPLKYQCPGWLQALCVMQGLPFGCPFGKTRHNAIRHFLVLKNQGITCICIFEIISSLWPIFCGPVISLIHVSWMLFNVWISLFGIMT